MAALTDALVRYSTPIAIALVAVWAGLTLATAAPGWINLLLTTGVWLLIFGVVYRGTARRP